MRDHLAAKVCGAHADSCKLFCYLCGCYLAAQNKVCSSPTPRRVCSQWTPGGCTLFTQRLIFLHLVARKKRTGTYNLLQTLCHKHRNTLGQNLTVVIFPACFLCWSMTGPIRFIFHTTCSLDTSTQHIQPAQVFEPFGAWAPELFDKQENTWKLDKLKWLDAQKYYFYRDKIIPYPSCNGTLLIVCILYTVRFCKVTQRALL